MATTFVGPRIRTLDGWRGVAISMVVAQHAIHWARFPDATWAFLGSTGVNLFFVISGFIITRRFLDELDGTSTIDLRRFYFKRAFRILPLVCVYLLIVVLLFALIRLQDFQLSEIPASLFFFRNYQFAATGEGLFTAHFWSLSVEEHFYLLWPVIFLWLGKRRGLWFALLGAVGCAAWRYYDCMNPNSWLGRHLPGHALWLRQARTDARFDGLLLGCAAAILLTQPAVRSFIDRNFPKETPLIGAILLLLNILRTNGWTTLSSNLLMVLVIASTLVVTDGLSHKWLNSRVLVWIGTISYSAYIWQELFLTRAHSADAPLGALGFFPFNILATFLIATLSFFLIERPCIALGRRLLERQQEPISEEKEVSA